MTPLLLQLGPRELWIDALHVDLLGRLVLAAVLGGIIGLERELSGKAAGLRTNLLICVGAALLMELSIGVADLANAQNAAAGSAFRSDPARIAAQIVSGIGFIGAGSILQARGSIVGLTTAATIWVVAAIGMAVGARAYIEAAGTTLLVFLSLVVLGRLEDYFKERRSVRRYTVALEPDAETLQRVEAALVGAGVRVRLEGVEKGGDHFEATFELSGPAVLIDRALRTVISAPGVHRLHRAT